MTASAGIGRQAGLRDQCSKGREGSSPFWRTNWFTFLNKRDSINSKSHKQFDPEKIQKKLKLASELFDFAFMVKSFQLKKKHPELTEKEIIAKTYALIERGCS